MTKALTLDECAYRELLARLPQGVVIHDAHGRVLEANAPFAEMLGYTLDEAKGLHARDVIHPDDLQERNEHVAAMLAGERPSVDVRRRLVTKDGRVLHVRSRKSITWLNGEPVIMVLVEDWASQEDRERELIRAAMQDPLTGLPNRRALEDHVARAGTTTHRTVAVIDLDRLKAVNDRYGHPVGDQALVAVADRLHALAESHGWFGARVGGDEFVLVAQQPGPATGSDDGPGGARPGETSPSAVEDDDPWSCDLRTLVAHALTSRLDLPDGACVLLTVSVGTAPWPAGRPYGPAAVAADADLYRRKRAAAADRPPLGLTG